MSPRKKQQKPHPQQISNVKALHVSPVKAKKQPPLPQTLHVPPGKIKKKFCGWMIQCTVFKPSSVKTILKACYFSFLIISIAPFIISLIGLSQDGSRWYGRVPVVQSFAFGMYLSLSIIQAIIVGISLSKFQSLVLKSYIPLFLIGFITIIYCIVGIIGLVEFNHFYSSRNDQSYCESNINKLFHDGILSDLSLAVKNLCVQTANCKCSIPNTTLFSSSLLSTLFYSSSSSEGSSNVLSCPYVFASELSSTGPKSLASLEINYDCSGICSTLPIYYFSSVSRGPPDSSNACFAKIIEKSLHIIKQIIGIPILVVVVVMGIILIIAISATRQYRNDPYCKILSKSEEMKPKIVSQILPIIATNMSISQEHNNSNNISILNSSNNNHITHQNYQNNNNISISQENHKNFTNRKKSNSRSPSQIRSQSRSPTQEYSQSQNPSRLTIRKTEDEGSTKINDNMQTHIYKNERDQMSNNQSLSDRLRTSSIVSAGAYNQKGNQKFNEFEAAYSNLPPTKHKTQSSKRSARTSPLKISGVHMYTEGSH